MIEIVGPEAAKYLSWDTLGEAIVRGHTLSKAEIGDTFLYQRSDTLLSRAAWVEGLGLLVKTATIFADNDGLGLPKVNGGVCLYSDHNGILEAVIDFHLVTAWKTAGDSVLAAKMLARPESNKILIVGAGVVADTLHSAYLAVFPDATFSVWNRNGDKATEFANTHIRTTVAEDLKTAVPAADIVTSATMSTQPLILGSWLKPGQHVDLIGAYKPDMREADDAALLRARVFVDSRETTLDHIGELKTPISQNVITRNDVIADFYDIKAGKFERTSQEEITLFKNGGGAHLDLMTSRYILNAWRNRGSVTKGNC